MNTNTPIAVGAALVVALAACGEDSDTDAAAANDELCALATELFEQDDFPSVEQLHRYQQLAPEPIAGAVHEASEALITTDGDLVESFKVLADDDIEAAIADVDAFEEETCGIPHAEDAALPDGVTREIEQDAARVDVHATDYAFDIGDVAAGRTSFVLVNDGAETHVLEIVELADGVTFAEALAADGDEGTLVGHWVTGMAAPGGDEEAVTFELEPGNYVLACYIPNADGTSHLELGMQHQFSVQ